MEVIREAFAQSYYKLMTALARWRPGQSVLSAVIRPDPLLLSRPLSTKHVFRTDVFERKKVNGGGGRGPQGGGGSKRASPTPPPPPPAKRGRWSGGRDERQQIDYRQSASSNYSGGNNKWPRY